MTRWAYAVLATALVLGSVSPREAITLTRAESELVESAMPLASALRKRNGKLKPIARRDTNRFTPLATTHDTIDLAPPRIAIVVRHVLPPAPIAVETVAASARAPPA